MAGGWWWWMQGDGGAQDGTACPKTAGAGGIASICRGVRRRQDTDHDSTPTSHAAPRKGATPLEGKRNPPPHACPVPMAPARRQPRRPSHASRSWPPPSQGQQQLGEAPGGPQRPGSQRCHAESSAARGMQLRGQRAGPGAGRAACLALAWVPQEPLLARLPVLAPFAPRAAPCKGLG